MKFEFTGNNASDSKLLLDGNPITYCQSIDFHIDAKNQIPIVRLDIIPTEGTGIIFDEVEGYITIGNKTYKLLEVVEQQKEVIE